jgi:hypothetical protein
MVEQCKRSCTTGAHLSSVVGADFNFMRSILVGTALRLKINGSILLDTWDGEGIEKLGWHTRRRNQSWLKIMRHLIKLYIDIVF